MLQRTKELKRALFAFLILLNNQLKATQTTNERIKTANSLIEYSTKNNLFKIYDNTIYFSYFGIFFDN